MYIIIIYIFSVKQEAKKDFRCKDRTKIIFWADGYIK